MKFEEMMVKLRKGETAMNKKWNKTMYEGTITMVLGRIGNMEEEPFIIHVPVNPKSIKKAFWTPSSSDLFDDDWIIV